MSSSRTAASARAKSIRARADASSSASVRVGVDMAVFGNLDDLGGRVLLGR